LTPFSFTLCRLSWRLLPQPQGVDHFDHGLLQKRTEKLGDFVSIFIVSFIALLAALVVVVIIVLTVSALAMSLSVDRRKQLLEHTLSA